MEAQLSREYTLHMEHVKQVLLWCRKLIGLDGCRIKRPHPRQLLSAVGIDANNGLFPIAFRDGGVRMQGLMGMVFEVLTRRRADQQPVTLDTHN